MKKPFLLLSLIMLSSILYAQVFKSNILGQNLEESNFDNKGYFIIIEGNTKTLYLDGEIYSQSTETLSDDGLRIVTETDKFNLVTVRQYKDGLLISEETNGQDIFEKRNYTYINGVLSFCSICIDKDSDEWDVVFFIRSQVDGSLIGVKTKEGVFFFDEDYILINGAILQEAASNLYINVDFEVDEQGRVSFTENGVEYLYSKEGRLLSTKENGYETVYKYNGEELLNTTTEKESETVIDEYDNNSLKKRIVYKEGKISSETFFETSGMIQIIYSNGKPMAKVTYKEDNRQVDSIEYYGD